MTNDELVELCIVALANAERKTIGLGPISHSSDLLLNDRDYIKPQVIAVISTIYEAVQEPDEGMHLAGELVPTGIGGCPPSVGNVWRAMLTASPLNGGKER